MPSARAIRSYLRSLALPPIPLLSLSPPPAGAGSALRLATACGGRGLAGGCSTVRPSARAVRCGPATVSSLRCGPHRFPDLRSGALTVSAPVLGREAAGAAWGERITPPRHAGSLCHACSLRQPRRRRGPPLRSGARGSARRRARATVAQAQPPLRPAKTQAKLRQGLAPAPSPRPDAKLHQPRVAPLRARVPKNRHIGDRPRT